MVGYPCTWNLWHSVLSSVHSTWAKATGTSSSSTALEAAAKAGKVLWQALHQETWNITSAARCECRWSLRKPSKFSLFKVVAFPWSPAKVQVVNFNCFFCELEVCYGWPSSSPIIINYVVGHRRGCSIISRAPKLPCLLPSMVEPFQKAAWSAAWRQLESRASLWLIETTQMNIDEYKWCICAFFIHFFHAFFPGNWSLGLIWMSWCAWLVFLCKSSWCLWAFPVLARLTQQHFWSIWHWTPCCWMCIPASG